MKEYKDTLLMPKTDFPMRGNLGKKGFRTRIFLRKKIKFMKKY